MENRMVRLLQLLHVSLLLGLAVPALAAPAGSVIDVVGEVMLTRNAVKLKAGLFDNLQIGDVLSVPQSARLVMTHNATKMELVLSVPGEFEIAADKVVARNGTRVQGKNLAELAVLSIEGGKGRTTVGAAPMRGARPLPTMPLDGETILTRTPELSWPPVVGVASYQLVLKKADGTSILEYDLDKARHRIEAEDLLEWGVRYQWTVSAEKDGRRSTIVKSFRVIDSQDREALERLKPGAEGEFSAWVLYAKSLDHLGALSEARTVWGKLLEMRPDLSVLEGLAKGK